MYDKFAIFKLFRVAVAGAAAVGNTLRVKPAIFAEFGN